MKFEELSDSALVALTYEQCKTERELLELDLKTAPLIVEHEYGPARTQDKEKLKPILAGSLAFTRKIDEAAACMFALQSEVLPAQGIPVQGRGREAFRS